MGSTAALIACSPVVAALHASGATLSVTSATGLHSGFISSVEYTTFMQTHVFHDGSAAVHDIAHPELRNVRISAYLGSDGTLSDAEGFTVPNRRAVRLSTQARQYAHKAARQAVWFRSTLPPQCVDIPWLKGIQTPIGRRRHEQQVPMSDEEAAHLAKQHREGTAGERFETESSHAAGLSPADANLFFATAP